MRDILETWYLPGRRLMHCSACIITYTRQNCEFTTRLEAFLGFFLASTCGGTSPNVLCTKSFTNTIDSKNLENSWKRVVIVVRCKTRLIWWTQQDVFLICFLICFIYFHNIRIFRPSVSQYYIIYSALSLHLGNKRCARVYYIMLATLIRLIILIGSKVLTHAIIINMFVTHLRIECFYYVFR